MTEKILMNWPDDNPPEGATDEPLFDIDDESAEDEWLEAVRAMKAGSINKAVVYLKPGQQPPQGVEVQRGKRGGRFYEVSGRDAAQEERGNPRGAGEEEADPRGEGEEEETGQPGAGAEGGQKPPPPTPEPQIDPNDPKVVAAAIRANWGTMSHEEKMAAGNVEAIPQQMRDTLTKMKTHEAEVAPLGQAQWGANAMSTIASNMYNRLHTYAARLPEDVTDKLDDQMGKMLGELQESNYPVSGRAEDVDKYMSAVLDALVYQEQQTWRRQLGDHGVRHIFDDIEMGRQMGSEMMDTIGHITKDDLAVMTAAAVFHDIGYVADSARLTLEGTKYHQHYGAEYVKQNRETFDNMFGVEATEKIADMIERHQDSDIDWQEDPMGTSLRVSDNLGLFAPEKLPALFNYIEGALDKLEEIHDDFLQQRGPEFIESHKQDLRDLVDRSSLNENIKQDLLAAVDEVFPMSGKFTLGMMAGEKLTPSFDGHTMHVPIRYSPEMKRLQQVFNIGQDAFKKLCDSYNVDESSFQKGEVVLDGKGGRLHVKVVEIPEEDQRLLWNSLLKAIAQQEQKHTPHNTGTDQSVHGRREHRGSRLANNIMKNGGVTYNYFGNKFPSKGMAVAVPDAERVFSIEEFSRDPGAAMEDYISQYKDVLDSPGTRHHLGGWVDRDNGRVYLDLSVVVDSHSAARRLSEKNKQEAYYDLATGKEHRVGAREPGT